MGYSHTQPACYLVTWDDAQIIKPGYSHCQRWRKFLLRGARLVRVDFFADSHYAFALESALDAYVRSVGVLAFANKESASGRLGTDGGGWAECFRVPDVAHALAVCERIADAFCERIANPSCTDGRVRTHALTQMGLSSDESCG